MGGVKVHGNFPASIIYMDLTILSFGPVMLPLSKIIRMEYHMECIR